MARRKLTQNTVKLKDINAFLEEFQEESDRAAAVLGAAYLDESLSQLIASFLVDDPTEVWYSTSKTTSALCLKDKGIVLHGSDK